MTRLPMPPGPERRVPVGVPRAGVSMIEVLVVLFVVIVLGALTVVAVQHGGSNAARLECANNMRQLATAVHAYESIHKRLPEGCGFPFARTQREKFANHAGISWQTAILAHPSARSDNLGRCRP